MMETDFLNTDEAAKFLKLAKPTLYKYVKEGRLPAIRMGKVWKFHKKLLEEWLMREMENAAQDRAKKGMEEKNI
jgi:excisionase family DNA binding protein